MRSQILITLVLILVWPAWCVKTTAWQTHPAPLSEQRTLDSYFPFEVPGSLDAWSRRRQDLRRHLQVSLGLWPMPEKEILQPTIHGKIDLGDYTIEKVYFESFPGFLVTGNLYRPRNVTGQVPGILCPHGHFRNGRHRWATDQELARELDTGAEAFDTNGRSPLQARCANLARMGCVVFHYDMVGYADSQQIKQGLAHGFRTQRPDMNDPDGWGFFSPQAELRLQSIMGLQTWNSIRSLDFLSTLPDVDATRIGVTGGSGGGTQTFILCAIDPRPAAAFPAVMVSTAMQGGCTCENCCNLRINAGNVEFAALFAPKPLGLTAANDWTKEMESKGFPELIQLYEMYAEAGFQVPAPELTARIEFPHNYNQVGREAMYDFFNRHLALGIDDPSESRVQVLTPEELTVFNKDHPGPDWSTDHEKRLLRHWDESTRLLDHTDEFLYDDQFVAVRETIRSALVSLVSHPDSRLTFHVRDSANVESAHGVNFDVETGVLDAFDTGLESELVLSRLTGESNDAAGTIKLRLIDPKESSVVQRQLDTPDATSETGGAGIAVLTMSTFGAETTGVTENKMVPNGRQAAGYTFGYNRTVFASRVSQVLYTIEYLSESFPDKKIIVEADRKYAPVAAVAFAVSTSPQLDGLLCELDGFRFAQVQSFEDENFFPGAVKYRDVIGFLILRLNSRMWLTGEDEQSTQVLVNAMKSAGTRHYLKFEPTRSRNESP